MTNQIRELCYSFDYSLNCTPLGPITITKSIIIRRIKDLVKILAGQYILLLVKISLLLSPNLLFDGKGFYCLQDKG